MTGDTIEGVRLVYVELKSQLKQTRARNRQLELALNAFLEAMGPYMEAGARDLADLTDSSQKLEAAFQQAVHLLDVE